MHTLPSYNKGGGGGGGMMRSSLISCTILSNMSARAVTLAGIHWKKKKNPFALIVIITDLN